MAKSQPLLREIIVTAQRRQQNIQDVGIVITALSGHDLRAAEVNDVQQLAHQTPGLEIEDPGTPANTTITIRGVGTRDIGPNAAGSVALYRDGAYAAFGTTDAMPLFDIQRVEVDEGPQGTLFGRNATGGLIQIVSNRPTEKPEGYARVTAGSYDTVGATVVISGPVAHGLLGRASFYTNRHDGWIRNSYGADGNSLEDYAGRLQLMTAPGHAFRARLIAYFNSARGDGMGAYQSPLVINPATGMEAVPTSAAQYASYCNSAFNAHGLATAMGYTMAPAGSWLSGSCFYADHGNPYQLAFNTAPYRNQNFGVTLRLHWNLDKATISSTSDYQKELSRYTGATDGSPLNLFFFRQNGDGWQFSQDLNIAGHAHRLHWIAGIYYIHVPMDGFSGLDVRRLPTLLSDLSTSFTQNLDSVAGYGQVNYRFVRRWSIVAGARWTRDHKSINYAHGCTGNSTFGFVPLGPTVMPICQFYAAFVAPGSLQFGGPSRLTLTNIDWSGKLQLQYRPTRNIMAYGGVSRGFKGGGFNATVPQFYSTSVASYKPEKLTDYEIGIKSTLAGGRVRLNASAFHYNYQDFQSYQIVGGFLRTINVQSKINGAEVNLQLAPYRGLYFQVGPSYLDAYSHVPMPNGTSVGKFVNPASPRWTIDALGRYSWNMLGGRMTLQVDSTHMTWQSTNAIDVPALRLPGYWRENARLSFLNDNAHWNVALFVTNLTNRAVVIDRVSLATLIGSSEDIYAAPREWGATLTYHW